MKILIVGSRTWTNELVVRAALNDAWEKFGRPQNVEIIHGNDPSGADMISEKYAVERGWKVTAISPNWTLNGKQAYDVRNREMVEYGADIGMVFFNKRSARTMRTIENMERCGIPYEVFWD